MVKGYTTTTSVADFLQITITSGSTPSTDNVNQWIEWAEDRIDKLSGFSYTTSSTENVYLSGLGYREFWLPREYIPVSSITKLEINTGSDFDETWVELTEGTDFNIYDSKTGYIKFALDVSGFGAKDRQLRLTVVSGYSTIPYIVEELATKLAVKKYLQSQLGETASGGNDSIRVGPIRIDDGTKQSLTYVTSLNNDITELESQLKTLKTYIY